LKILVTGGAGFIGSNFIRHYLSAHPESTVVNFDKLTYAGNLDNLSDLQSHPGYKFVLGDVCDADALRDALDERVDAIVHFAAESHVDRSIAEAREFIRTNVLGTCTLLEAARRAKLCRFVHVSTDEVYGSLPPGTTADERAPLLPNSPYAASKAASDLLVRSFWETYRFPALVTRSSNNYGPYQFPEKFLPLMITNALEDKLLPVYGDGLNERDWIFVGDHCRALDRVLEAGRPGETYNIGYGQGVTNLSVVRRLLQILRKPEDLIKLVEDRPGHDRRYALDSAKIRAELGWKPAVTFEEGLLRTVEWYRLHPEWVQKAKSREYRDYYRKYYENRGKSLAQL
jgi:dTDP-glucose 4,6-dehydratase